MQLRIAAILAAALIGALYSWVLLHFWGMHAIDNVLLKWLREEQLLRDHVAFYRVLIWAYDALAHLLLALPFASLFVLIGRLNNWLCLLMAVVVATLMTNWGVDLAGLAPLLSRWSFWAYNVMSLAALPLAFIMLRALPREWMRIAGSPT